MLTTTLCFILLNLLLVFSMRVFFCRVNGNVTVKIGTKIVPVQADIVVNGIAKVTKSGAKFGDYYRPLAPGKYKLTVKKAGYKTTSATVVVPASGKGVIQNFVLTK